MKFLSSASLVIAALGLAAAAGWGGETNPPVALQPRLLEETELKSMLTAALQRESARDRGELELRLTRPWAAVAVPDAPLTLRILDLPSSGISPNFIARFELRAGAEALGSWQMPLQARLWREIWVAGSAQPRGRLLREADLQTERRDLLTLRDALTSLDPSDPGLELAENLAAGAPLTARSLRVRPIVARGKLLEAIVEHGPLLIMVKVEALEDGLPGQSIRVRNTQSRKEFHAQVKNSNTVKVSL